MNIKSISLFFVALFFFSTACSTEPPQIDSSNSLKQDSEFLFTISEQFKSALRKKNFLIHEPEKLETTILIDNMWQLNKFFINRHIFEYTNLRKFRITNTKNNSSASLYSFQFNSQEAATSWFNVFYKTNIKGQLKISFGRPKKMLGLVNASVILIEGYSMSNYENLNYIVTNLDGVTAILDPVKISIGK